MRHKKKNLIFEKYEVGDVGGMPFCDKILPKVILDVSKLVFSAESCNNMSFDQICTLTYQ